MSIQQFFTNVLSQDESIQYSQLPDLSALSPEDELDFKTRWPHLPVEFRRQVLDKLTVVSEDNVQLDFTSVYFTCLFDEDIDVRDAAIRGLSECEDRALIQPLVVMAETDNSVKVRASAVAALGKFVTMSQENKLVVRDRIKIISALFGIIEEESEDVDVRRRAIESIAALGGAEVDGIIDVAYNSSVLEFKQSALYAMGRSSNLGWISTILREMQNKDNSVRYEATVAAGFLGEESVVPFLKDLVNDPDLEVQLAAIRSLGIIGGSSAKAALLACLDLDKSALVETAQESLDELTIEDDPLGTQLQI